MSKLMMMFAALYFVAVLGGSGSADEKKTKAKPSEAKTAKALKFKMKSLAGKDVDLGKYQGKVVLVVNVASECGLTPQYDQLQALHEKYANKGLAVLGFPCNQFGSQEPGDSKDIQKFCKENYGVTFDMFDKVQVNGADACGLYKHLTKLETKPKGAGKVGWNFEKFLINRDGEVIARFEPNTAPDADDVVSLIESSLKK
jgi:glutathione peroxidase